MTVYHGSTVIIQSPELYRSIRTLDFGPGFYTTTNREQAVSFTLWEAPMTNVQFKATLEMLVPLIIKEIEKKRGITGREAFEVLYTSFLYSKLEQEQTKLWHLSPLTLANLCH
jgi:hypothetical protein